MRRESGLTLLEVLLVLVLGALLSAGVVVALRRPEGDIEQALETLRRADAEARFEAGRGPVEVAIDVDRGAIVRRSEIDGTAGPSWTYGLPAGVEIRRVWAEGAGEDGTTTHGEVVLRYTREGASPTWAVEVAAKGGRQPGAPGAGQDGATTEPRTMVVAGLTGEVIDADPRTVFETLGGDDPR